jgi:formylglycine-generating enzyme required for sulfatase activity
MKIRPNSDKFQLIKFSSMTPLFFILVFFISSVQASDLKIENVRYLANRDSKGEPQVVFDISWHNAWRNPRNYDAAWVFMKFPDNGNYKHVKLAQTGHKIINMPEAPMPEATIKAGKEGNGFFIYPKETFRGNVRWRVSVKLDTAQLEDKFRGRQPEVFGVEMVYVPTGAFTLGEPGTKALEYGAFFRSDAKGEPDGLIEVESESPIQVGTSAGNLYYRKATYVGDQKGLIPESFPKGFNPFYIMKYELTQGQYSDLLNTISDDATFERVNFGGRSYFSNKGTILLKNGRYMAAKPNRPMNFITWDDGLAFADWAGLRPLTELEFTKAARGSRKPMTKEFPWGTSDSAKLARIVDREDNLTFINELKEDKVSDKTLSVFGASYFWVLDLSGSLWERVITIGSPDGRAFKGSHGDGQLTVRGNATNADWPNTHQKKNGHGFRGGGFYFQGGSEHEFNPYSPIAYRRFGGWSGGDPHMAYGFRAGRTAD